MFFPVYSFFCLPVEMDENQQEAGHECEGVEIHQEIEQAHDTVVVEGGEEEDGEAPEEGKFHSLLESIITHFLSPSTYPSQLLSRYHISKMVRFFQLISIIFPTPTQLYPGKEVILGQCRNICEDDKREIHPCRFAS